MAGRKPLAPAEQHGPEFVGATPADMAAQEAGARNALAVVEAKAAALAQELGYQGALTIGTLEDEIRFYQRRTVEAILEAELAMQAQHYLNRGQGFDMHWWAWECLMGALDRPISADVAVLKPQGAAQ